MSLRWAADRAAEQDPERREREGAEHEPAHEEEPEALAQLGPALVALYAGLTLFGELAPARLLAAFERGAAKAGRR